jgi:CRISPR-associated protein Csm2
MIRGNDEMNTSDYTAKAEKVILELRKDRYYHNFTTSKIRNILSMVNEIYNDVLGEKDDSLPTAIQDRIMHLKVRLIYECGRERMVKKFYEKAGLDEIISGIGSSKKKFISFVRYMEALVAYHLYYGGGE